MNSPESFIKDIETFFLSLSEKGVMLSSRDYFLIREWMEKGYTKEQLFHGIKRSFQELGKERIRNVQDCKEYVENSDRKQYNTKINKIDSVEATKYITKIIDNIDKIKVNVNRPNLLSLHNNIKSRLTLISPGDENFFEETNRIETEYFCTFPQYLEKSEREILEKKLDEAVNDSNDYINEESKKKALNIHLKNLIIKEYIFFNPFDTDI